MRLCRDLFLAALICFVAWVGTLSLVYRYPQWMMPPAGGWLSEGSVLLGAATPTTQLLWLHLNDAFRAREKARAEREGAGDEQSLSISFRVAGSSADDVRWCKVGDLRSLRPRGSDGADSGFAGSRANCGIDRYNDDTILVRLRFLQPCTTYSYSVQVGSSALGEGLLLDFTTPPRDDQAGCASAAVDRGALALVPADDSAVVRFSFGSCLGISPFSDIRAFNWLSRRPERTDFVLLLGDTVYVDIPRIEDRLAYNQIWSDAAFVKLFTRVPFYATYDDHEIINDWSLRDPHEPFHTAMRFYDEMVGSRNPPPPVWPLATPEPADHPDHPRLSRFEGQVGDHKRRYYHFRHGQHASVFVLDTRQYASPTMKDGDPVSAVPRTKLGALQKAHLLHWLSECQASGVTFKFVASSVAWSSTAFKFVQDGWAAYRDERDEIFDFIRDRNITGVVLLSADLHWSGVFHFKPWNLYEVTASPIQSFPLPHWISSSDDDVTVWSSPMRNHIGEVEIHAPSGQEPYLNVSVFRWFMSEPQRAFSAVWKASEMVPKRVE